MSEKKKKEKGLPPLGFEQKENGDWSISYSSEHVKLWERAGILPAHMASYFHERSKKVNEDIERNKQFWELNPDATQEEFMSFLGVPGKLTQEETEKLNEEWKLSVEFNEFLKENIETLSLIKEESLSQSTVFRNVDFLKEFGISNCIANAIYHLENLLKNMTHEYLYGNQYTAKGTIENSKKEAISLTYSFTATSEEEAEAVLEGYKKAMITKGLRVWLAHWLMANKVGRTEYACPMIDIMKLSADEDRSSFYSTKEKEEHWSLTKMLEMSKLLREKKVRKRGTGTEVVQWIEQPLVEIIGGEKDLEKEEKYPGTVAVRVLMPKINDKKAFAPHLYKNETLQLSPSDIFLAFKLQTRAGQMGRGTKEIRVDWEFIFEAGNLQATAEKNHRGARAKARKKMDRLKENETIENWEEDLIGVRVTPKKTKKENPKKKTT